MGGKGGKGSKVNVGNGCALRRLTYEMGATEVNCETITIVSSTPPFWPCDFEDNCRISVGFENNAAMIAELDADETTWCESDELGSVNGDARRNLVLEGAS